jgi:hypothetical protein
VFAFLQGISLKRDHLCLLLFLSVTALQQPHFVDIISISIVWLTMEYSQKDVCALFDICAYIVDHAFEPIKSDHLRDSTVGID